MLWLTLLVDGIAFCSSTWVGEMACTSSYLGSSMKYLLKNSLVSCKVIVGRISNYLSFLSNIF